LTEVAENIIIIYFSDYLTVDVNFSNFDLQGRTRASGGKLFAKSLAKNFKSLALYKHRLIGAVVSTKSGARLCGSFALDPKVFGKV